MRVLNGWAMLTGVLVCGSACSGKELHNLGEINHGSGGTEAASGGGPTSSNGAAAATTDDTSGSAATTPGGVAGGPSPPRLMPPLGSGGEAGDQGSGGARSDACDVGNGCVFQTSETEVKALTADSSTLYWVEYGSFDELGNYQNDGRLMARAFDQATTRVIAANLEGPVAVGVTDEHAFVYLDRAQFEKARDDLVRVPLTAGDAVLVTSDFGRSYGGDPDTLVRDGGTAYLRTDEGIFRMAPSDTVPTLFANITVLAMALSGDSLYVDNVYGTYRIPLATGAPEKIADAKDSVQAGDDHLYALDETGDAIYLTRAPLAGRVWTRLPPKQLGAYSWRLQILGDLFFYDVHTLPGWHLFQGNLADTSGAQDVLALALADPLRGWVGTSAGVFWMDGNRIRLRMNPVP